MTSSCGGIFRDDKARHLGSFCAYLHAGNVVSAELLVAIMAIENARDNGWNKLWLETDCIFVVKAFSKVDMVPWHLKARWSFCCAYTLQIDFVVSHTFREANFCADLLANIGYNTKKFTWFDSLRHDLSKDFLLDKQGFPRFRLCT
ncbi:uncharacterized protein LOC131657844 [Vicia villosa]|uniref:uncharacterized protein LOC131657844 n=1 Tax=Vicia villosa TaxID=3911 RepID=UPI00273A7D02|nr:uncharacterized protein LOC131657844 [Vicia villosa]